MVVLNMLVSDSHWTGLGSRLRCGMVWFQIADGELLLWSERVALCLSDYASPECSKPNHKRLQWIVSRRTAQNLHSYRSVPELPTIPEGCWDESERSEPRVPPIHILTVSGAHRKAVSYQKHNWTENKIWKRQNNITFWDVSWKKGPVWTYKHVEG